MRRRSVKPRALTGRVKSGALTPPPGGRGRRRPRARAVLPRPPKLSRREIEERARRIADRWLAEIDEPLEPRHSGAIISSLARAASASWDDHYWAYESAHHCALETVRKYRWHVPTQVWDMLSAWALLDVTGAIRR